MNVPNFMMMMPPWMMPGGQAESQRDSLPELGVPPRVNKAMDFIALLTQKVMDRPSGGDVGQIIDGKEMLPEEAAAHAAACQLLARYFDGKLVPDTAEALREKIVVKKIANIGVPREAALLLCVMCPPHTPMPGCRLCKGSGKLLVMAGTDDNCENIVPGQVMSGQTNYTSQPEA